VRATSATRGGLRKKWAAPIALSSPPAAPLIRQTADGDVRGGPPEGGEHPESPEPGHRYGAERRPDLPTVGLEQLQGLLAVGGQPDPEAVPLEGRAEDLPQRLVVRHQDAQPRSAIGTSFVREVERRVCRPPPSRKKGRKVQDR